MKKYCLGLILCFLFIITNIPAHSDDTRHHGITLDGTLGTAGKLDLPGPDFDIKAEYGTLAGTNLFHSFQKFNILSNESATFRGPGTVHNIISRVTGGDSSRIDGTLRSAVPGADLYLLNPAGVMFGPNASLDLGGSFHVSTADYLRMGDDAKFHAALRKGDVLSVEAPAAFGFLDNDVAPVTFRGGEIAPPGEEDSFGISVSKGKTISVIGGNIEINKGISYQVQKTGKNGEPVMETRYLGNIRAAEGRISIASVGSAGEVIPGDQGPDVSSFENMGDITISDKSSLSVSGDGSGSLFIRGGHFFFDNSCIFAETMKENNSGVTDIRVGSLSFTGGACIFADTMGTGKGADVKIRADDSVLFAGERSDGKVSTIQAASAPEGSGSAGSVHIEAGGDISFEGGAWINTAAYGKGSAGTVTLRASDAVLFAGENSTGRASMIQTAGEDSCDAGGVHLEARDISFTHGAWINTKTSGKGNAGPVTLRASDTVLFAGERSNGKGSMIQTATASETKGGGDAGNVHIEAGDIKFADGAYINLSTRGEGKGGALTLKASDTVSFAGETNMGKGSSIELTTSSRNEGAGNAGTLFAEAGNISFTDGAYINASAYGSGRGGLLTLKASDTVSFAGETKSGLWGSIIQVATEYGSGDAGSLLIDARDISFTDGAYIDAATYGRGKGGKVTLMASDSVLLAGNKRNGDGTRIQVISNNHPGEAGGDAGTLLINAKNILLKDNAYITGGAYGKGRAGNITLLADELVSFSGKGTYRGLKIINSLSADVEITNTGGNGGEIYIEAQDLLLTDGAVVSTRSFGPGAAGNISIRAGTVTVTGWDEIGPSGIYAGSENSDSGHGGNISLSAQTLNLRKQGKISASCAGKGKAGRIKLDVARLDMDTGSSVISESQSVNSYVFSDISERDNSIAISGDVIRFVSMGKESDLFCAGKNLIRTESVRRVASLAELNELENQYMLQEGDVVKVDDAGDGNPGTFIFSLDYRYDLKKWVRFTNDADVTFDDITEVNNMNKQPVLNIGDPRPYSSGRTIRVSDAGDGKTATYVYTILEAPLYGKAVADIIRLRHHTVSDITELNRLPDHFSVKEGDVADVTDPGGGTESRFVFSGDEWIKFNNVHTVGGIGEQNIPAVVQAGTTVRVDDAGDGKPAVFICTGKSWITLNEVHTTANMTEQERLSAQTGDVVYVSDADGRGNPASFFYAKGEWTEFAKGDADKIIIRADTLTMANNSRISASASGHGDAADIILTAGRLELDTGSSISSESNSERFGGNTGAITIAEKIETDKDGKVVKILEPADSVSLKNNSFLTTGASDAAGGNITVSSDMLHLDNSMITTGVRGGDGRGGDIGISRPRVAILNNSMIRANAHGGDGGNIHIVAEQFMSSSESIVEASSDKAIDGNIMIESPDADISRSLTSLSGKYLDAARWLPSPCSERSRENTGRFVLSGRDSMPFSPDDWLPSPPLAFYKETDFWLSESGQVLARGEDFFRKGRFEQAVRIWEQASGSLDPQGVPYFQTMLYLADVFRTMGHCQKALSALHSALPAVEQSRDFFRKALFFSSLGDFSLAAGNNGAGDDHSDPRACLRKGVENARQSDNPLVLASVLNNMGNVLAANGDYWGAEEAYKESLGIIAREPVQDFSMLKPKVLINLTRVRFLSPGYEEIFTGPGKILPQIEELPDSHGKAADLVCFSLLTREIRNKYPHHVSHLDQIAFKALNRAKQIAEVLKDERIISYSCGYLGQLYEEKKDYDTAVALTRKALFSAQQNYCPEILYLWQWQMGRLFKATGDARDSAEAYRSAIETLDPVRSEFFTGHRRKKYLFNEKVKPVYLEFAGLLLTKTAWGDDRETRLKQARDTMERLKSAELQDFFEDECVTDVQKERSPDHAPSHTAVIYPILLPDDRLVLLLTLPDGIRQISVPVSSKGIGKDVRMFRERLQDMSMKDRFLHYAKKLYQCLIQPLEAELSTREIDTLVIAPDGVFRLIPFSALHDGRHFLIEKYAVATIPGITLTDPGPVSGQENSHVLLNGLSEARQEFHSLPRVRDEIEDVRRVMGGRVLLDKEYTTDNLSAEFGRHAYSVVHMATHGKFGASPRDTYLLTYDGRLTMKEIDRIMSINRSHDRPVELLTLSACQTALGDERSTLGLAGVALRAGVKSAMATLWSIEDEAASLLVREFYRQMKIFGHSKAKALQNAQKKFIAQDRHSHPAYWASFLLIGNWL